LDGLAFSNALARNYEIGNFSARFSRARAFFFKARLPLVASFRGISLAVALMPEKTRRDFSGLRPFEMTGLKDRPRRVRVTPLKARQTRTTWRHSERSEESLFAVALMPEKTKGEISRAFGPSK
jgi:hypothetical protein